MELLEHGLALLEEDSDRNRRLAIIAIDNAVELAGKTYLGLPRRVTGLAITRRELDDACRTFPNLLDALEKHASGKFDDVNIGEIEWYHRLRNQLYHDGNGLTVVFEKANAYAELARLLFKALFDVEFDSDRFAAHGVLGQFITEWVAVERTLRSIAERDMDGSVSVRRWYGAALASVLEVFTVQSVAANLEEEYNELRVLRNDAVHGQIEVHELRDQRVVQRTRVLRNKLQELAKKMPPAEGDDS